MCYRAWWALGWRLCLEGVGKSAFIDEILGRAVELASATTGRRSAGGVTEGISEASHLNAALALMI
jgi:ribosome biogenesis GTPase A